MLKIQFCFILIFTAGTLAFSSPELIVYNGKDQTGDGIIFRSKQPDLMSHSPRIVSQIQSYCYKGHWAFYGGSNFDGTMEEDHADSLKCVNVNTKSFLPESTRFLGPDDMNAVAITFYDSKYFMNKELIVRKPINLPFVPGSFVSNSGPSQLANWSFFEDNDYASRAICYTPKESHEKVTNLKKLFTKGVKTVAKGCDSNIATQIRGYYTAADLEDLN